MGEIVVLTGATSGIGFATAKLLLQRDISLVCAVRDTSLARKLFKQSDVEVVYCDLVDSNSFDGVTAAIEGSTAPIILINMAGASIPGPIECLSEHELKHMFSVNVFGAVELTRVLLPFIRKNGGRIVNIGSISGEVVFPGLGGYSASKFALRAISDALRLELQNSSIHVALVEPGNVETPIWDKSLKVGLDSFSGLTAEVKSVYEPYYCMLPRIAKKQRQNCISPSQVAEVIAEAALSPRPKPRYLVGGDAFQLMLMKRILPIALFDQLRRKIAGWGPLDTV